MLQPMDPPNLNWMEKLLADLAVNRTQLLLTTGLKQYLTMAKLLRTISSSTIIFQIHMIGIQTGVFILVAALLTGAWTTSSPLWIVFLGAGILTVFVSSLLIWNSERAWIRRLKLQEALKSLEASMK